MSKQAMFKGLHHELTNEILRVFYQVYNALGYGFLERVYENALVIALRKAGLEVVQQQKIDVYFEGQSVGHYIADIIVNRKVILEIKAVKKIVEAHRSQLLNYLASTDAQVGLLLNFGPEPKVVRRILTNDKKPNRPKSIPS